MPAAIGIHGAIPTKVSHAVLLPPVCCPVSKNPKVGSTLRLSYAPGDRSLEVYSLSALLRRFVGGYPGSVCGTYPAERNMEGMIQLVAQMSADALGVPVSARAHCLLDTGEMIVRGRATPATTQEAKR
jgi:hypothetical protein